MINLKFIVVGKLKDSFFKQAISEYKKRMTRFAKISEIEVDDEKIPENCSAKTEEQILDTEAQRVLEKIKTNDYVILLDLHGEMIDSVKFARKIENLMSDGVSNFVVAIGGSLGVGKELRKRANYLLSLSLMTFTHQMSRVIINEQFYRAFKIMHNEKYHK